MLRCSILCLFLALQGFSQSQLEMNASGKAEFDSADAELNKSYREILQKRRADTSFVVKFKRAQRAWVVFRDAHVDAIYSAANARREYGSVYPSCRYGVLTALTRERVSQLQDWIKGVDETDTCGGSRMAAAK